MLNTTRHDPNSIGEILAAKILRLQRRKGRPRPRTKRRIPKRPPPKPRLDPRTAAFKRRLEQTPNGRRVLRLVEQSAKARLAEDKKRIDTELR